MLTFKNTNIAFIVLLTAAICADSVFGISWQYYLYTTLAYFIIVAYGCYFIQSNFFMPVICFAKTSDKVIAITFDDGPVAESTLQILKILEENGVEAAFFCIGNRIAGNENIINSIQQQGHLIGNHSYTHSNFFDLFSAKKMRTDLLQMDNTLEAATGDRPLLFRPPFGVINPNLKKAVIGGNYIPVGWNVRSFDTVIKSEARLLKRVSNKISPGNVFLFHDTCKNTIAILPEFISTAKLKGYKIVRLDKMLDLQAYR